MTETQLMEMAARRYAELSLGLLDLEELFMSWILE